MFKKMNKTMFFGLAISASALVLVPFSFQKKGNPFEAFNNLNKSKIEIVEDALSKSFQLSNANAMGVKSTATASPVNLTRMNMGFVVGYGSRSGYEGLVCETGDASIGTTKDCDGPPQKGMVGALADITNEIPSALANAGIASCDSIPASGTGTGTSTGSKTFTFSYAAPTHLNPTGWEDGGVAFTKRLEFTTTSVPGMKGALEFRCDKATVYLAINMEVGSNAVGYDRTINGYFGQLATTSTKAIEIYLSEHKRTDATKIRTAVAIRVNFDSTTNLANIWGLASLNFDTSGKNGVGRFAINTDVTNGLSSLFYDQLTFNTSGQPYNQIDTASALAITGHDVSTIGTSATFALASDMSTQTAGTRATHQGCMDFSTPSVAPTSATLCTGKPLSSPSSAPVLDATGSFTVDWLFSSMTSHLEALAL